MTAPSSFPAQSHHSQSHHRTGQLEKFCEKGAHLTSADVLADLVVTALWKEFGEGAGNSEKSLADAASHYFRDRNGKPISSRTIQYWLRGQTLPSALHLSALVIMQPGVFLGHWLRE